MKASECGSNTTEEPEPDAIIKVTSATFGSKIKNIIRGNVTKKVQNFCDSKSKCGYKVSEKFLGAIETGKEKSFSVSWTCQRGKTTTGPYTISIPSPAAEKQFDFGCTAEGGQIYKQH